MEIFSLVLLVLYVVSTLPVYVVAENAVDASTASTLIKEGQSAEILCMAKGTGDFFWRKGESLLNSSLVASFTGGQVRKDAEPYVVTENGTLIIKIVTLGDEGKYFCRVSSVINECYGELNVFVEASLRSFVLAIDRCDRESSCLLYISPTQSTTLTCTATDASPSMTLKWFNGSTEITEGIEKYDLPTQNGNAREIRSTITTVYGHPASLTCQAVDPKRGNNDVRFAHAQVETTVPVTATLQSWIIVAITLAGCLIVFGIYKLIKAMANRTQNKKYKKLKTERHQSLQEEAKTKEETINLKHKELTEVKVSAESKDRELTELKGKLSETEEELKKSRKENIDSLEIAKAKDQEIKTKDEELTKLKSRVPHHLQEISSLKGDVQSKEKALADLESKLKQKEAEVKERNNEIIELQEKVQTKANEITELKETVKQRDIEIKNQRENLLYCQTSLHKKEIDVQSKIGDISKLQSNLKEKQNEIVNLQKELAKLKDNVQSKPKGLADLETKLRKKDEAIKEAYENVFKLQGILKGKQAELEELYNVLAKTKENFSERERELNLAKQPKGAQKGSQKKSGKKH